MQAEQSQEEEKEEDNEEQKERRRTQSSRTTPLKPNPTQCCSPHIFLHSPFDS